jgi:hypothetical protein
LAVVGDGTVIVALEIGSTPKNGHSRGLISLLPIDFGKVRTGSSFGRAAPCRLTFYGQ